MVEKRNVSLLLVLDPGNNSPRLTRRPRLYEAIEPQPRSTRGGRMIATCWSPLSIRIRHCWDATLIFDVGRGYSVAIKIHRSSLRVIDQRHAEDRDGRIPRVKRRRAAK